MSPPCRGMVAWLATMGALQRWPWRADEPESIVELQRVSSLGGGDPAAGELHALAEGASGLRRVVTFDLEGKLKDSREVTANDVQSTRVLAGVIVDRESGARLWSLEASTRLGDRWRLELEARAFGDVEPEDPQYALRNDDYVQLTIARFF